MKKKLIEFSPFIAVAIVIVILFTMAMNKIFDEPEKLTISSSTLQETVQASNISTAKYIQNGICKAYIQNEYEGYIMYYATVKLNVDFSKIEFDVNHDKKTVTPNIPDFSFDVDLDEDRMDFYPDDDLTAKEVLYLCEEDAKGKANENQELMRIARENLLNTIEAIIKPLLDNSGYVFIVK